MSISQQVLKIILEASRPISRYLIQQRVTGSYYSTSKELTRLKKSGLIQESRGNYAPTAKALDIFKNPNDLDDLPFQLVSDRPKKSAQSILNLVDWDYVASVANLAHITNDRQTWCQADYREALTPFILVYLIQSGVNLPVIENNGAPISEDILEKMEECIKLIEVIQNKINAERGGSVAV